MPSRSDLYEAGDGRFEFDRTASRLMEMRSDEYLAGGPRRTSRLPERAERGAHANAL